LLHEYTHCKIVKLHQSGWRIRGTGLETFGVAAGMMISF
jgi:hypothetical protein